MNKYNLYKNFFEIIEEFEKENDRQPNSLHEFSEWVLYKQSIVNDKEVLNRQFENNEDFDKTQSIEVVLSRQISILYKFAKHYSKKILQKTELSSLDEFGFLAALATKRNFSKSELINFNLMEMTSGIEIIKRLLRRAFIEEFPDPNDKRAKRLKITQEGLNLIVSVFNDMNKVSFIVSGNLSEFEKHQLSSILTKLENFHFEVHNNDKSSDVKTIVDKYISAN